MIRIFISTFGNFRNIPKNVICVGVSKEFPPEFCTTGIHNFLYTPQSVLRAKFNDCGKYTAKDFEKAYRQRIEAFSIPYGGIRCYFEQMFGYLTSMCDGAFGGGVCFLDDMCEKPTDTSVTLRYLLEDIFPKESAYKFSRLTEDMQQPTTNALF